MSRTTSSSSQEGFTLAALIVLLTIISLVIAYTVPQQWSMVMKRERDRQTIFIMKQFARGIMRWQMKHNNTAPVSLQQMQDARSHAESSWHRSLPRLIAISRPIVWKCMQHGMRVASNCLFCVCVGGAPRIDAEQVDEGAVRKRGATRIEDLTGAVGKMVRDLACYLFNHPKCIP